MTPVVYGHAYAQTRVYSEREPANAAAPLKRARLVRARRSGRIVGAVALALNLRLPCNARWPAACCLPAHSSALAHTGSPGSPPLSGPQRTWQERQKYQEAHRPCACAGPHVAAVGHAEGSTWTPLAAIVLPGGPAHLCCRELLLQVAGC
jgi:hypothetical protein